MAIQFGAQQNMTITAGGLTAGAARSSAAVTTDNTKNIAQIWLDLSILTTSTAPSGGKQAIVYGYLSGDGTNYTGASGTVDNVDGTDKAVTAIGSPTNLFQIGTIQLNQGGVALTLRESFEVTAAFGGIPSKWGFVLYNDAGTAFGATITAKYREDYFT